MLAYACIFALVVACVDVANAAVITRTVTMPPPYAYTTYVSAPTVQAYNSTRLLPDLELNVDAILSTLTVTTGQVKDGLQCALDEGCLHAGAGWFSTVRLLRFDTNTVNVGTADFRPPDAANPVWHECHAHFHGFEKYANYYITRAGEQQVLVTGHKASFCLMDSGCRPGVAPKYGSCRIDNQGISVGCWDAYTADLDCQWVDITQLPPGTYDLRVAVNEGRNQPELRYDNNQATVRFTYNPNAPGMISNKMIVR